MRITDILDVTRVLPDLKGGDKKAVLREMSDWLAALDPSLNGQKLLEVLLEREKVSSTAVGEGVAIPHGKLAGIKKIVGVFARSPQGVNFDSLDGGLTHLFFLLLAPENSAADHLKALARISRLLKDGSFRARLMRAKTGEEMFHALKDEDDKL